MTDLSTASFRLPSVGATTRRGRIELVSRPDRSSEPGLAAILVPYATVTALAVIGLVAWGLWGFGLGVAADSAAITALLIYLSGRPDEGERIVVADGMVTVQTLGLDGVVRGFDRFPLLGLRLERIELATGEAVRLDLRHRDRCREIGCGLTPGERHRLWRRLREAIADANATPVFRTHVLSSRR